MVRWPRFKPSPELVNETPINRTHGVQRYRITLAPEPADTSRIDNESILDGVRELLQIEGSTSDVTSDTRPPKEPEPES